MLGLDSIGENSNQQINDLIIASLKISSASQSAGIAATVFDSTSLSTLLNAMSRYSKTTDMAQALTYRKTIIDKVSESWDFPMSVTTKPSCPFPWILTKSPIENSSNFSTTYKLSHKCSFIGKMIFKIRLPYLNLVELLGQNFFTDASNTYLGAYYNDLVPRLIKQITLSSKNNTYTIFTYTGIDLFIHNMLFSNDRKNCIDLAQGEDKFELNYDPFRIDSSALGVRSFVGLDTTTNYAFVASGSGQQTPVPSYDADHPNYQPTTAVYDVGDGFVDSFVQDTTMTFKEFKELYRHNVWYEAPVASNYYARHSIHERRVVHDAFDIVVPLDILPFGETLSSSIPSTAIGAETGFIKIDLYEDWLDRSFYLINVANIQPQYALPQHKHAEGGLVDPATVGQTGVTGTVNGTASTPIITDESIINAPDSLNRENIVPTYYQPTESGAVLGHRNGFLVPDHARTIGYSSTGVMSTGRNSQSASAANSIWDSLPTDNASKLANVNATLSELSPSAAKLISSELRYALYQISFSSLQELREVLSGLPYIYLSMEYADESYDVDSISTITASSNLFSEALLMMFVPNDRGVPSFRVYPHHLRDHEYPIVSGVEVKNNDTGASMIYDWNMLNIVSPMIMGMNNGLRENIGIVSFSPAIDPHKNPYGYYDNNILAPLQITFKKPESSVLKPINLRNGKLHIIQLGYNGLVGASLSWFKLIF